MAASLADVVDFIVHQRPGLSEADLAKAVYGQPGYRPEIEQTCSRLVSAGTLDRRAGPDGVHTYFTHIAQPAELGR
ncbi:hypothetical protein ACFPL7_03245 [Dongia soli]|uniref:MarR family transcriptional regulator n=1 Tax=Dongia soli TaxID=600628 RepID=A0ABU5EFS6_9PROT|nr:hypothetical protein [Dongia soli]MDY0884694.1 hypothetical protein [Dongia soli]